MSFFDNFWSDAHDVCVDATEPVAIATGAMYDMIGGPEAGAITSGFVEENWPNVCDLPSNLAHDFGYNDPPPDNSCPAVGDCP